MALCDILALERWQRCQPVSVLSLDIPDRTVLKVAGLSVLNISFFYFYYISIHSNTK